MLLDPRLIEIESLRPPGGGAPRFEGAGHGGVPVSAFLVDGAPGAGPRLHRHPYDEVFVLHEGEATFTVGGVELVARAGQMVIAPRQVPHRFRNTGAGRLRMTAIHPSDRVSQEWLE